MKQMILKILGIADQADQSKQRLVLKVKEDGNLSEYAVVDNTYKDGEKTNLHQHYYSFPNYEVKKDDQVILYTCEGKDHPAKLENGITNHFFYWGLKISVWNDEDEAHILKIMESSAKKIESKG